MKRLILVAVMCCVSLVAVIAQGQKITVAADGSGDYRSVQAAIDAVPDNSSSETVIYIKNGTYKECLTLPASKTNVHFIGESVEGTILTYDNYASKDDGKGGHFGTSGSSSFFIYADGFTAENITFENASGPVGQAVAVRVTGDKATFINCKFLGCQDTLYTHGDNSREYYYKCYIEGTVDFIFGAATAVFEDCTLYAKNGGYYTAASTPPNKKFGYVFLNCKLTGSAPENSFLLGRPWRPDAHVVFLNCYLDKQVKAAGWFNWGKASNEKTAYYAEYMSKGPGANPSGRVSWSKQLTKKEAKAYTLKNIFGDWQPRGTHK